MTYTDDLGNEYHMLVDHSWAGGSCMYVVSATANKEKTTIAEKKESTIHTEDVHTHVARKHWHEKISSGWTSSPVSQKDLATFNAAINNHGRTQ